MSIESQIDELIVALRQVTAALLTTENVKVAAKKGVAAATQPTPPAATPAAAPAQAPAAAPPAQSPEVSTVTYVAKTGAKKGRVGTGSDAVNFAVLDVASHSRDKALAVLATFKVTRTPELKAEQYQAVIDALEEELAKIDAASVQASLV